MAKRNNDDAILSHAEDIRQATEDALSVIVHNDYDIDYIRARMREIKVLASYIVVCVEADIITGS